MTHPLIETPHLLIAGFTFHFSFILSNRKLEAQKNRKAKKMNRTISVVIIDTDKKKINYIKRTLSGYKEKIYLAALADSVETGIKVIKKHNPKIIFLDINMTDDEGVSLLERVQKWDFEVIILENSEYYKLIAKEKQKSGFILKKIDVSQLIKS